MIDQLNYAPCGYFVMESDGKLLELNATLEEMLGRQIGDLNRAHILEILTTASKIYYQTYFLPLLSVQGTVNEIYLTLKCVKGNMPVLLNASIREENGQKRVECILVKMKIRDTYEDEILQEKRNIERSLQRVDEAYKNLEQILSEVNTKKKELEILNAELEDQAITDPLTGLKNRRYLLEEINKLVELRGAGSPMFSVLLIDIDHFKYVNDTFGHPVGDLVLQEVSLRLTESVRETDIVTRMGGEEFVVILPNTKQQQAMIIAEKLRATFEHNNWVSTPITISIGIGIFRTGDTSGSLLSKADVALYQSKQSGRNRVTVS